MEKRIITWLRGRICTAFIQDGSLVELTLEDEDCSVLNRIYVGRVQKVVPGINAAFIDTGDGVGYYSLTENRSHLFTDRNRKEGPLRQGDEILVADQPGGRKDKGSGADSKPVPSRPSLCGYRRQNRHWLFQ